MINALKIESNITYTENGAVTYQSSGSHLVDLFASVGALRNATESEIVSRFIMAFSEDKSLAVKMLFYARDIRQGLGERRVFRIILNWLAHNEPEIVRKNIKFISEYGRYDDLLCLFDSPCETDALEYIQKQFTDDISSDDAVSLLGKWLPSINASNKNTVKNGRKIAKYLGLSGEQYRKHLVALRKRIRIIENNLRERDYSFDYEKQPSRALFKYRKAFIRNDRDRYSRFLDSFSNGKARLNMSNVMPYELVESCYHEILCGNPDENLVESYNAMWNALPDYCGECNAIAVVDTSGSMYGWSTPMPASVAISLGMYFAQRNKGVFANHFISFSSIPQFIEIKGETFVEKFRYISQFNIIDNTDIEAVFKLILNAALKNGITQNELPERLIIISDMEFDYCAENASLSNFESAKRIFAENGYCLPDVVFWNVQSRNRQQPVSMNEQGVILVSGCTPQIFSMVMDGSASPYKFMMSVLMSERYKQIAA